MFAYFKKNKKVVNHSEEILDFLEVDSENLNKKIQNTPLDYSNNKIWVYFELWWKKFLSVKYMLDIINFLSSEEDIIDVEKWFNLFICNQEIPEVIRILEQENQWIYQVVRIS